MWNGWQRISVGSQHIKWQGLCISVIPAPEKQKDHKFKVILNYIASFKASMGLLRPMGRKQRLRTSKMVQQVKECLHKPVTCVWSAQTQRKKKNQLMNSVPYPIIINIKKKKKKVCWLDLWQLDRAGSSVEEETQLTKCHQTGPRQAVGHF